MMLRICRAKARRYIPSLRVGFCSAALKGGIGCKQCRHTERVWNLLDEGSAFGFAGVQPSHSERGNGLCVCEGGIVMPIRCKQFCHPERVRERTTAGSGFALTGAPSFAFCAKGGNGPCSPWRPPNFAGALGNLPFLLSSEAP